MFNAIFAELADTQTPGVNYDGFSDLHKDVHGGRPGYWPTTQEKMDSVMSVLHEMLKEEIAREEEWECDWEAEQIDRWEREHEEWHRQEAERMEDAEFEDMMGVGGFWLKECFTDRGCYA